jgi:hypothetical protein
MPLLYLIAAVLLRTRLHHLSLMIVCLRYARNLDAAVLAELANLLSGVCFVFLACSPCRPDLATTTSHRIRLRQDEPAVSL